MQLYTYFFRKPRFLDVNQHNSVSLPACFVLKLKPKVLLIQQIATKIEKETGLWVILNVLCMGIILLLLC